MTPGLVEQIIAEYGPWALVAVISAFFAWQCVKRQSAREDRMSETVANNTAALQTMESRIASLEDKLK